MLLSSIDYIIIGLLFVLILSVGIGVSLKSIKNSNDFFLSGRNLPWWILGLSMVATTFSTDTPNLVTSIVRTNGVSGNWVWWAFLITGLLTVFIYAKLWRKSGVTTDIEFYELRYGGKPAKILRQFRAVYLGLIFNALAMAAVNLAAIKIGQIMLNLHPWETIVYAGIITLIFSTIGGFKGVVYTDFILFFVAMGGSIAAAYYLVNLPEVGGLSKLVTNTDIKDKLNFFPDLKDTSTIITLLVIPLAVQWWSSWYPGAEPGGGGYIAQRMLAAKDENHAVKATFFFNIMHYALRPWPWIIVALASLVVFPDLESIQNTFSNITEDKLGHDLAYSAMLTKLPHGLLGLVLASLIAAYMSTISTHLNWGASYLVNDFYKQLVNTEATEKQLIKAGRIFTISLMILSAIIALQLQDALQLFDIILMFGAGTGLIFILRWFWHRINAWSEIAAMISSGLISIILNFTSLGANIFNDVFMPSWAKYPTIVFITTLVWIITAYLSPAEKMATLENFILKIKPNPIGWKKIITKSNNPNLVTSSSEKNSLSNGLILVVLSTFLIYSLLFSTGLFLYKEYINASLLLCFSILNAFGIIYFWKKENN